METDPSKLQRYWTMEQLERDMETLIKAKEAGEPSSALKKAEEAMYATCRKIFSPTITRRASHTHDVDATEDTEWTRWVEGLIREELKHPGRHPDLLDKAKRKLDELRGTPAMNNPSRSSLHHITVRDAETASAKWAERAKKAKSAKRAKRDGRGQ
jgi:hypothetical protein